MAALSLTGRLGYGGLSIVDLGLAVAIALVGSKDCIDVTEKIKKASGLTQRWLVVAKICAEIGLVAMGGTMLFCSGRFASFALSGTISYLSPAADLMLDIAAYGGLGLMCLQDLIRWACR